ncbi:MAG TPA: acetyltransferase [Rhodocyclaceae bacterium]|nr:acetyltransferase [Rhodocyclaceae bacterium]HRQ47145.1 acetyltransferase [Rhodocyclaceae bacterium]
MMDVVIFGLGQLSKLAWYVLAHDSPHRVVGFTVHDEFMKEKEFMGLPVTPFERLADTQPPERVGLLAPTGWKRMNAVRAGVFAAGKEQGYRFASYVASRAVVWPDLHIGENCMVFDGALIQPFARVGDNCVIRSGVLISHDVVVGDHCFVAGNAVIAGNARVGDSCVIGLSSTIRDDCRIARRCFIGAGAVVVSDTEEGGVYLGVPARRSPGTVDDLAVAGG